MSTQKMVTEAMQVIQVLQQAEQHNRARMAGDGTEGGGDDDELTMEELQRQIAMLTRDLKKHTAKSAYFMKEKVMDESIEAAMVTYREEMTLQIDEVKAQHKIEMTAFKVQVNKDVSAHVAEAKEQFQGLLDEAKTDMRRQIAQIKEAAKEDAEKQVANLLALMDKGREEITLCILDNRNQVDAARDAEGVSTVAKLAEMTSCIEKLGASNSIALQRHANAMTDYCTTAQQEREDANAFMEKRITAQDKRFKGVMQLMTEGHQAFTAEFLDMRTKEVFATSVRQLTAPPAAPRASASRGGGRRDYEPGDLDEFHDDDRSVRSSRPSVGREGVGVPSRSGRAERTLGTGLRGWVDGAVSSSDDHAYPEDSFGGPALIQDDPHERRPVGQPAAIRKAAY
jgi:hypothetical protein